MLADTELLTTPAAVLWDMDGTLVDTEPYWITSEIALVAEFGGTWTHEDGLDLVGQALPDSARMLRERGGVDLPDDELIARLIASVVVATRENTPWRPGALELLNDVYAHGVPCALVTMSYAPLAEAVVDACPPGVFSVVVSGDQVRNGKPHPEPYLVAAAALGVDPSHCVAIEDSAPGVESAQAAGTMVLAVEHLVPIAKAEDRIVLDSLSGVSWDRLSQLWSSNRR